MMGQYRFSSVMRLAFRIWARNALRFTLLSMALAAPLVLWLLLDLWDVSSAELILYTVRDYGWLSLRGLSLLVIPMISAHVVQSLAGGELSLPRSVWLSGRGVLTQLMFLLLQLMFSFLPVMGAIASFCLDCIGFVAIPAAVTERLNPLAALERSSNLNRGRYRTTVALMITSALIIGVPAGVAMVHFVMADLSPGYVAWMEQLRANALIVVGLSCLLMPFQGIVRAVSYVQLRRDSPGAEGDLAQVFA